MPSQILSSRVAINDYLFCSIHIVLKCHGVKIYWSYSSCCLLQYITHTRSWCRRVDWLHAFHLAGNFVNASQLLNLLKQWSSEVLQHARLCITFDVSEERVASINKVTGWRQHFSPKRQNKHYLAQCKNPEDQHLNNAWRVPKHFTVELRVTL